MSSAPVWAMDQIVVMCMVGVFFLVAFILGIALVIDTVYSKIKRVRGVPKMKPITNKQRATGKWRW